MTRPDPTRAVRIANCSGFYGDRIGAARDMVEGGPIDVLTGDYLAELTMLILAKAQQKDPAAGYAKTFLTQIEQVLGSCVDRGIKVVANAGERLRELLGPEVADLKIDRFDLPNLRAINVVVHGLLGDGVASCTRPDPQAKGLGEYLRSTAWSTSPRRCSAA